MVMSHNHKTILLMFLIPLIYFALTLLVVKVNVKQLAQVFSLSI